MGERWKIIVPADHPQVDLLRNGELERDAFKVNFTAEVGNVPTLTVWYRSMDATIELENVRTIYRHGCPHCRGHEAGNDE